MTLKIDNKIIEITPVIEVSDVQMKQILVVDTPTCD